MGPLSRKIPGSRLLSSCCCSVVLVLLCLGDGHVKQQPDGTSGTSSSLIGAVILTSQVLCRGCIIGQVGGVGDSLIGRANVDSLLVMLLLMVVLCAMTGHVRRANFCGQGGKARLSDIWSNSYVLRMRVTFVRHRSIVLNMSVIIEVLRQGPLHMEMSCATSC